MAYQDSGYSVDASARIESEDRAGLERLLRYCARPHTRWIGYANKAVDITLTLLELIERIAALVPPARKHRHRQFGVLAPNSPLRSAAMAMAAPQVSTALLSQPESHQRAGHRCGTLTMCRCGMCHMRCQTGIWRHNQHQTISLTSV